MLVTGWDTAQQVTVSNSYFDGTTDYGHYYNGKHFWVMLLVAENQTITFFGHRLHNTSERSPEEVSPRSTVTGTAAIAPTCARPNAQHLRIRNRYHLNAQLRHGRMRLLSPCA